MENIKMGKNFLEDMLANIGLMRTDQLFLEYQKTREAINRLKTPPKNPDDDYFIARGWRENIKFNYQKFKDMKADIILLNSSGTFCYVPKKLRSYMHHYQEADAQHSPIESFTNSFSY